MGKSKLLEKEAKTNIALGKVLRGDEDSLTDEEKRLVEEDLSDTHRLMVKVDNLLKED